MRRFTSIERIDTAILYVLELTSSISVLLLAFGLIASMANVLTKGSVLTDNLIMQRVWAWTQCIAIDASVAGTIIRTFRYHAQRERVKSILHGLLSVLLLFTAAIVSNIESVQQTLNVTLEKAYVHVFIPVEALIWVRSFVIVLLIVAHAMRHVMQEPEAPPAATVQPVVLTPEVIDAIRAALAQVTVREEQQQVLLSPHSKQGAEAPGDEQEREQGTEADQSQENQGTEGREGEQEENKYERAKHFLLAHPGATDRELASFLLISPSTANRWKRRIFREANG